MYLFRDGRKVVENLSTGDVVVYDKGKEVDRIPGEVMGVVR